MNENTIQPPIDTTVDNTQKAATRKRSKKTKNLLKRGEIWYFVKMVKGKRRPVSLATNDLTLAAAKRDALLAARSQDEFERVINRPPPAPTIDQILLVYQNSPFVRANRRTRTRNIGDLYRMVRLVRGPDRDVGQMSSTELDWRLVEQWQLKRHAAAEEALAGNLAAFEAAKRSLNRTLKCVQSIFCQSAMNAYRELHLPPNITEFVDAPPVPARKQEDPVPLGDDQALRLVEAAGPFFESDPGMWAAFQLMFWGGLRNVEACHARTSWLERTAYGYRLSLKPSAEFVPKGNSREVIIPSEVARALLRLERPIVDEFSHTDTHLVPATSMSDRRDACYRRLNEWLKASGVGRDANKIAYRLRKYFLKKVAVQQHPLMAQAAGGHSSMSTTQDHYIGKPRMMEPIRMPVDLSKILSFRIDQKPFSSSLEIGTVFNLQQAAQLLEVNAGELAARAEKAESVTLDGYVLTVRREGGINGQLVPPPA